MRSNVTVRSNVSLSKISIGVAEDSMSKSDKFKCQLCPDTFAFKNSLKKHVSSYHQRNLYMCDLCTSTFLRKDSISPVSTNCLVISVIALAINSPP